MEGAKSAEDGLIGPSVFLLDGGSEEGSGGRGPRMWSILPYSTYTTFVVTI
jgi:hypothetical protein